MNTTQDFSDSVLVPTFNDLILFLTHGVLLNADAMGEDTTADQSTLCKMETQEPWRFCCFFFIQEEENKEMLVILMRSKKGSKQEKKKPYNTHLHVTLKTCLPQDVLAGQRKRTKATILSRWWMGWADRSLLSPSLSFTLLLSFPPSFPLPPASPPPLHPKPQFVPSDCGPEDGFHQVTDLSASARGKTPQTLGNARRPTAGKMRLKHHLYLLGSQ